MQQNFIYLIYPLLKELADEGVELDIDVSKAIVLLPGFFKNECKLKLIYDTSTTPETKKIIALYREGKKKDVTEVEINTIEDLARLNFLAWVSNPVKNSPTGFAEPEKGWREIFAKRHWIKFLRLSQPDMTVFEKSFGKDETEETVEVKAAVEPTEKAILETVENVEPFTKETTTEFSPLPMEKENEFEL